MLMNNQPVRGYDPTTAMLTQILPESFPKMQRWQFPRVEYAFTASNTLAAGGSGEILRVGLACFGDRPLDLIQGNNPRDKQ